MAHSDDTGGPKKIGRFLKKVVDLPASLARALTVARVIEERKIPTPWRAKILHVQLVEMKNKTRYVQLLLVDGDMGTRVALDAIGAVKLEDAVRELRRGLIERSKDQST